MSASLKEILSFRKEPNSVELIPYSYHITPHVISTPDGRLMTMFRLTGRTHECASDKDIWGWYKELNQLLVANGKANFEFWTHLHHHEDDNYPEAEFPSTFARQFDRAYRGRMGKTKMMVNDHYLTVVFNHVTDFMQSAFASAETPTPDEVYALQESGIEALEEISDVLMSSLKSYGIERLGIYYRDRNGKIVKSASTSNEELEDDFEEVDPEDGLGDLLAVPANYEQETVQVSDPKHTHTYSTALEWLGFLVNGEFNLVPVCRERIRDYLGVNRIVSSTFGDVIQIRSIDRVFYSAGVELREHDEGTEPGQLNTLFEVDFEFVMTQSFSCMAVDQARKMLNRQQASMIETGDSAISQVAQITTAADDVVSRRFVMGTHHLTIHTFADTDTLAQRSAREVRSRLSACGIVANPIGLASEAAWYAKLPGRGNFRPRPMPINSGNFACLSSFHNFMSGKPINNPWGQAVTMFRTRAETPLFFNFHPTPLHVDSFGKRPAGHTLLLGKTGAGKSTLLSSLLSNATKYNPRMFIYDKDMGLFPLVKALGGNYTVIKDGEPSGFAPLQLSPTSVHIAFAKRLVRMCASISAGRPLVHSEIETLSRAVDAVMGPGSLIPIEHRTFSSVLQHLPDPAPRDGDDTPSLASLFSRWCVGGDNGWLFDNEHDSIDFRETDIHAFDLTDFIGEDQEHPVETRTPLMYYLLFRVRESIDGKRRVIQAFDEFAMYLDDPVLAKEVKRGLKTDRKKDTIYVFSTQEPNDALESMIGKSIAQAVATLLLLYNPEADPDDYKKGFKLTEAEFDAFMSIAENSYEFLIKQGSQTAIAKMNLSGMDDEISVLSGTPDNAELLMNVMRAKKTADPDVWLPAYYAAVRQAVAERRSNG